MRFQKSQPAGAATLVPPSASTGPLKNMDVSSPHEKRTPTKCAKKLAAVMMTRIRIIQRCTRGRFAPTPAL